MITPRDIQVLLPCGVDKKVIISVNLFLSAVTTNFYHLLKNRCPLQVKKFPRQKWESFFCLSQQLKSFA